MKNKRFFCFFFLFCAIFNIFPLDSIFRCGFWAFPFCFVFSYLFSQRGHSSVSLKLDCRMNEVLVGDALLDIAKAKKLASFMGGAWHDEQDAESDSEEKGLDSSKTEKVRVYLQYLILISHLCISEFSR